MCGIFLLAKSYYRHFNLDLNEVINLYRKLSKRGSDQHSLRSYGNDIIGFHRLAINDVSEKGMQPFNDDVGNYLMCNGEIYNHRELERKYSISPQSGSDCECLFQIIKNREQSLLETVDEIDGVFAIIAKIGCRYYFIRDRIGVKPLFIYKSYNFMAAASEPQALEFSEPGGSILEVPPGSMVVCDYDFNMEIKRYYNVPVNRYSYMNPHQQDKIISETRNLLWNSVSKRLMSDRPVGCLLSGGLDSSIISSIVARIYKEKGLKLNTFSVGFSDSTDLKYARKAAEFIGSNHHELIITPKTAIEMIPTVVKNLGTWDITTIRASTPMWILCNWISANFQEKVLFSGEGADEVFGGYLYFHSAPSATEFAEECSRLVSQLYRYDVLRADRCVSGNSLDLREPFLDRNLIDYYLTLPPEYRTPVEGYEKWILRKAFDDMLPKEVCWRRKTAFSDGISSSEKPWYRYIQEWTDSFLDEIELGNFKTAESKWYHSIFNNNYTVYNPDINYWLPKWQGDDDKNLDPSATTLKIWNKNEH